MSEPPRLTDPIALAHHRRRAGRAPSGVADVLHRAAADELQLRLEEVNRTFTEPVVVSGFPSLWADLWPGARQVADDPVLDLTEGCCDLAIHALALHWADDPVGQLVQMRRALRPDGLCLAVAFGGETLGVLRRVLADAEIAETGGLSPRVAPMVEVRDYGALLQRAGFALPVADRLPLRVSYRDALHLMHDLRAMGETNALAARHRRIPPRALFARAAAAYAAQAGCADGRVEAVFELVFLTGWAPAAGQPQPLRPGSAAQRLADALGTIERPLPGSKD